MDTTTFDSLARLLGRNATRRATLRGLASGAALLAGGGAMIAPGAASAKRRRKSKKKQAPRRGLLRSLWNWVRRRTARVR